MTTSTSIATTNGPQGAAIQTAKPPSTNLKSFLEQPAVKAKLAEVADKFMKPEDLVRLALMAASRQPDLLKCSPESVLRALMDAAAVGIVPGGTNGRGYLIPRSNKHTKKLEAVFDPGWRGLADIAKRSGKVSRIEAHVVYTADLFQVELGLESSIVHNPNYLIEDRGQIIAAYAIAFFADGSKQFEVLSKADIDKIKATSAAQNGPWGTWYSEMARKSAVRRLVKYLPAGDETLERALEMAGDVETGERTVHDGTAAHALPSASDTDALEAALMGTTHDAATGEVIEAKQEAV